MRNLPVNKTGYLKGAKTAKNSVNVIPSNLITTQGMAFPIKANGKTLYPNTGQYKFNTPYVVETPLKQDGDKKLTISPLNQEQFRNVAVAPGFQGKATLKEIKEKMRNKKPQQSKVSKTKPFTWKPPTNVAELEEAKRKSSSKEAANRKDNVGENLAEFGDPSGILSWDDASNALINAERNGVTLNTGLEVFGALPLIGMAPRLIRGSKTASQIAKGTIKGLSTSEKVTDIPELYRSYKDSKVYQEGSEELKASEAAKFSYRIKDKKRRDTQVADMYNNTLDSFRGDTTGAKRHFKDFFTHYGSERFNDIRPLEGYYGFDKKDYDDKTLDSLGRNWHKQMRTSKKQDGTKSTKTNPIPTPSLGPQFKPKTLKQVKAEMRRMKPQQTKASGKVDMTAGPLDAVAVGAAGIPGLVGRTLTSALPKVVGALNTPLTTAIPGVTAGNILSSVGAADAMVNRLPKVPGQVKKGEYGAATENVLTGGLDLLGANVLNPNVAINAGKAIANNPAIKVGRDLRKIKAQGLAEGLSEYEIAKKQLEQVGITSNQRKAYIPGVSDFLSEYVFPFGYDDKIGKTIRQVLRNKKNSENPVLFQQKPRIDAWRMYLGKPQKHNTFRLAETAPANHSSYTPEQLKKMDILSLNAERNLIPERTDSKVLLNPIDIDIDTQIGVMGGYNRRLSSEGLQYNDIWDLEPKASIAKLLPDEVVEKVANNKTLRKLLFSKFDENEVIPRQIKLPIHKFGIGKPFMSHGNISDYTWQKHKSNVKSYINSNIRESLNDLSLLDEKSPMYEGVRRGLNTSIKRLETLENLPEIKKQGSKDMKPLIKYKDGSKGVSLSFGRKEKDPKGGLTQKGVDKYNRATGGNLKMAVTTPPSKLKPGSKAANRRKSFCARMSGVKGPMEKNGKPTRKALALRKWNC